MATAEQRVERAVSGCVFACFGIAATVIGFAAYGLYAALGG